METKIWLDLDDTLIKSFYIENDIFYDDLKNSKQTKHHRNECHTGYLTFLRPIGDEIIKYSKELVGSENVYILTAASRNYALDIVREMVINISFSNIMTRDELDEFRVDRVKQEGTNILIDDLPYYDNYHKLNYLDIPKNLERYIQIAPYSPFNSNEKEITSLEEIKVKLKEVIDKTQN